MVISNDKLDKYRIIGGGYLKNKIYMIKWLVEKPKITQVFERADIFEINYYGYLII